MRYPGFSGPPFVQWLMAAKSAAQLYFFYIWEPYAPRHTNSKQVCSVLYAVRRPKAGLFVEFLFPGSTVAEPDLMCFEERKGIEEEPSF